MANRQFNCNKIKRSHIALTLKDETDSQGNIVSKGLTLNVRMPKKGTFETIMSQEDSDNPDVIYEFLAEILSNNKEKIEITAEQLKDYDYEECMEIIQVYMDFIDELRQSPNLKSPTTRAAM